ncbi:CapA family protein [Parvibaculum sp.]|uniref:CapA family protein n=1 Tax=Parvibaculum sp. TaxID=2024848 RepID=UPI002634BAE9|nr:CapA family protein [Parvibaculum sp.]MCW5727837.1 CapA family protein [Parvibaculum sp.]
MQKRYRFIHLMLLWLIAIPAHAADRLTVVLAGDTGLNASGAPLDARGGWKGGQRVSGAEALAGIGPWLQGDVVFANLETVVTDRSEIAARDKMFVFRMHPQGVREFAEAGINVFSLANNHALDYGTRGAGETLAHVATVPGLRAWPGLGRTRDEAMRPHVFEMRGLTVAVSAVGNAGGGLPAREGHAGMLQERVDFSEVAARLKAEAADLRILSVHYGREFDPLTDAADIERFRRVAAGGGATIVAGHHAHVAKGVEISGSHLVAYGLGNFLHLGTQNMARFDICRDFGLLLRVGLVQGETGLAVETVEAVPLKGMHLRVEPMGGEAARLRLEVLNYLGRRLDGADARGLRFRPQADGSGLWCAAGAGDARCAGWTEPEASAHEGEITAACGRVVTRGNF